jgi:hypothetical protein
MSPVVAQLTTCSEEGNDSMTRSEFIAPLVRLLRHGSLGGALREFEEPEQVATVLNTQVSYTYLHLRREHGWPADRATSAVTIGGLRSLTDPKDPDLHGHPRVLDR